MPGGGTAPTDDCSPGYFCKEGSSESKPDGKSYGGVCPAGAYCPAGTEHPVLCPEGLYSSLTKQVRLKTSGDVTFCPSEGRNCGAFLVVALHSVTVSSLKGGGGGGGGFTLIIL